MFDLTSFIRQYLPAQKRTAITIAICELLFWPILALFESVASQRQTLINDTQQRGQVIVLEELLNREAFGSAVGSVYIIDANNTNLVDFQVLVPSELTPDVVGHLRAVLDKHSLSGKRYEILYEPKYDIPVGPVAPFAFTPGFPYMDDTKVYWAVNKSGTYRTAITRDGTTLFDTDFTYVADVPQSTTLNPGDVEFDFNIAGLIASVSRSTTPVTPVAIIRKTYFQLNQVVVNGVTERSLSIYLDGEALTDNMTATLQGLNGTYVVSPSPVRIMDAPNEGIAKPGLFDGRVKYQCLFPKDNFGTFRLTAQVGSTTVKTVYDFTVDTAHVQGLLVAGANPANTITPPPVVTPPTPPPGSSQDLDTYLGPAPAVSGNVYCWNGFPEMLDLGLKVINGKIIPFNKVNYVPPPGWKVLYQVDNGKYVANMDNATPSERRDFITVTMFVVVSTASTTEQIITQLNQLTQPVQSIGVMY